MGTDRKLGSEKMALNLQDKKIVGDWEQSKATRYWWRLEVQRLEIESSAYLTPMEPSNFDSSVTPLGSLF